VCILFAGSVFSPRYAARLRRAEQALPVEHAAVNLALYRGGRQVAWVMSEYRGVGALAEDEVAIGRTRLAREGAGFRLEIVERSAPWRLPIEGTITVTPEVGPIDARTLGAAGGRAHGWRVVAPRARVRARFARPAFALDAPGYHDRNHGDARLEDGFSRWGWARFHRPGETAILYSLVDRAGARRALAVRAFDDGRVVADEPPPGADGPAVRQRYGLMLPGAFSVGAERFTPTALLERAPFYARFRARLGGFPDEGLGEYLDLDRFRSRGVQFLLRYKMRHGGRGDRATPRRFG
jgi:carotenoid 1,2-hydratase